MKELGLYIHIPFCVSKCHYCNFVSYAGMDKYKSKYKKAIIKEIIAFSSKAKRYVVNTIYIGGGTPSCFDDGAINEILTAVRKNYILKDNVEISIESNPNSITESKVKEWRNAGVNRVSIGLQSCDEGLLKLINRPHTLKDYFNAIKLLRRYGFNNINTDIMVGLPNQTMKHVKQTTKLVLKTNIPHVSAYALILEEDTPLHKMVKSKQLTLPSEDKAVKMYDYVYKKLKSHNINRYEVSNFAKRGYECAHNLNCWNMVEYVGFGVSANSYFGGRRWGNVEDIKSYIDYINHNVDPKEFNEKQTKDDLFDEYVMLKLRTTQGLDLDRIKKEYGKDLLVIKDTEIKTLKIHGLIKVKNNYLFATAKGFKFLNQIILDLVS